MGQVHLVRTPQGQFAYVTVSGLNQVKVYTTYDPPRLVATIPMGNLPHGLWPSGDGSLVAVGLENANAVALIDTASNTVKATIGSGQAPQGLVDIIQAAVTGLEPKKTYFLATSMQADGSGTLTPIAKFMSNPAGAAIFDAVDALRSTLAGNGVTARAYLVVAMEQDGKLGKALQVSR